MNIGIVGSRKFLDVHVMDRVIERLVQQHGRFILVSGGAAGADSIAAQQHELHVGDPENTQIIHRLDSPEAHAAFDKPNATGYQNFCNRAFGRNEWIVRDSDMIIAFFVTPEMAGGTLNTVGHARRKGIPIYARFPDGSWRVENQPSLGL